MDSKNFNAILFLAFVLVVILAIAGKVDFNDLLPSGLTKSTLRWRLGWLAVGATIAFAIVWGKKLPPEKALWAAVVSLILAYLLF